MAVVGCGLWTPRKWLDVDCALPGSGGMYDVIAGVDGGEVVCEEGVEQGAQQAALSLRSVEVWEPTHTLWRRSDGKTLIQMQVLSGSPWSDSLTLSPVSPEVR